MERSQLVCFVSSWRVTWTLSLTATLSTATIGRYVGRQVSPCRVLTDFSFTKLLGGLPGQTMATATAHPRPATGSDWTFGTHPAPRSLPDPDDTWALASTPIFQSLEQGIVIQAKIVDWVFVNIFVETPRTDGISTMPYADIISSALQLCRSHYGHSLPVFASTIMIRNNSDGELLVWEQMCPAVLAKLSSVAALLRGFVDNIPLVSRTSLSPILSPGFFFCPNTRLVDYKGRQFVAKGPIYSCRVEDDFLEVKNLLQLRRGHPHIIPPPAAFITVSDADQRVCGFLSPFFEKGNLDIYCAKLRDSGDLTEIKLLRWFHQLVDAVGFLIDQNTWHGDLKPDNILVDSNEDIVLIDFTRKFTTYATASPEVRRHCTK